MDDPSITVGLDYSEGAVNALGEARRMAVALGARLDIVHVAEPDAGNNPRSGARWSVRTLGRGGESFVERAGVPWVELTRHVRARRPLMLVVGSHGASGYHPLRPGSTAARLAVSAPCPVLIVSRTGGVPVPEEMESPLEESGGGA